MSAAGFVCSKNALTALNSLYIVVAVILIGVGVYANGSSIVTDPPLVAGIIAAGVFLFLVAILGLYGAAKHHQVVLFFYMIILFLVFLIQFFVAVACIAITGKQLNSVIEKAWGRVENGTKLTAAKHFHCCGGNGQTCVEVPECSVCCGVIARSSLRAIHVAGAVGLFFSFTEIIGIWLAMRYRNEKDPRANPHLFL